MANTSDVNQHSADFDFRASIEDFAVEFSVESVAESLGIDEESIDQREALLKKYSNECRAELDRLTCNADNLDLLASVCCGVAAGIMDAVVVGKWDFSSAKALSDEEMNRIVTDFAKKNPKYKDFLGRGKDGDRLENAIAFLEKEYHLPGDGAYQQKGLNMGVGGKDHRLADFSHHNSVVGMICSILVQFTDKAVFFNPAGELFRIPITVDPEGQFVGENTPAKIFSGIVNWFISVGRAAALRKGHLMSDKATSQGIPGTFLSIVKELSVLPCFKDKDFGVKLRNAYANGIGTGSGQLDLGQFNALFSGASSKFDMRTEMAIGHELKRQSIPVMVNEMLVRGVYFVRRFIAELQEKGAVDKIDWRKCIPINNRTIQRMVTVASGTFVAVDLADAFIESAIESKGNQAMLAEGVILRINFVNIGRFALGCAVDIGSGARKTTYEFMSIELTTGSMAVATERTFLHVKKRGSKAEERELILAKALGEEITIDKSGFSLEEAQLAAKELAEKKILSYEEMKDRPWYKKLYAAATFHSADKKRIMEDVQGIEQILTSFMQAYDSEMDQLDKRVARLEDVIVKQQEELAKRDAAPTPQAEPAHPPESPKKKKPVFRDAAAQKPATTLTPDIYAKYGGKYKIVSAKDPGKAISIFYDRSFMGGINSMNKSLELVSKNNLNVTIWTIESCGKNIYRIMDSASHLVIEYAPGQTSKTLLFVKRWKEAPSCIWEIRDKRDGTVEIRSNADIELGLKYYHGNKVAVGKPNVFKDDNWILERVTE